MSEQARHIPKEKKQLNPVQGRGREAKMVMHQRRGKRRPRCEHEHAFAVSFYFCDAKLMS
jgi:hypothetical protein